LAQGSRVGASLFFAIRAFFAAGKPPAGGFVRISSARISSQHL
jgi:hypothetical protein